MPPQAGVKVEGLAEFRAALKVADAELPRVMRLGFKQIADKVAGDAKASFGGRAGVAHRAAADVRALARQSGASIAFGGAPWDMGAEFGGQRRATTQQFEPWRGAGTTAGYSLYPAIRAARARIVDELGVLFDALLHQAFPD